jgi:hypothetical protein
MNRFEDRWWRPDELLDAALAAMRSVPEDEFMCDSAHQPTREALVACWFALRRPWNRDWEVRPVPAFERFPDMRLRSGGDDVRDFEIVESDLKNRRRCDEYRRAKALPPGTAIPYEPATKETALDEITRVIGQKAAKNYSTRPNLLVYVNLDEGKPTSLDAWSLREMYGPKFASAWLLWQAETFRLWPSPCRIKRAVG